MRLVIFTNAWRCAVANDHYAGDGKRSRRHGVFN